ncbi:MAG: hypothetical protein ABEH56_08205 [Salinirussus sp.]
MSGRSDVPDEPGEEIGGDGGAGGSVAWVTGTLAVGVLSAALFAGGLLVTESIPEFAVDVDFKPFFVPYLLIAFVPYGTATLSVAGGAAVGEGMLDISEGYELDDPFGFIGYVVGFLTFGWYLKTVADDPSDPRSQAVAATVGAFVQAVFEGVAFSIFEAGAPLINAAVSVLGNTVTHGVVLGAVPLVVLYPFLEDRVSAGLLPV